MPLARVVPLDAVCIVLACRSCPTARSTLVVPHTPPRYPDQWHVRIAGLVASECPEVVPAANDRAELPHNPQRIPQDIPVRRRDLFETHERLAFHRAAPPRLQLRAQAEFHEH